MSRLIDLTGKRFGHLYVIKRDDKDHPPRREAFWICQCDCPNHNVISVCGTALRSGHTTSCGCYQKEHNHRIVTHKAVYKEGITKKYPYLTHTYYRLMRSHFNELCDEWKDEEKGLYNFINDMKDNHRKHLYLHRHNVEKKYSKENCYWDTRYYVDMPPKKEL